MCISASATRDGLNLIAVVLGAPSSSERFDAATTLLDYGFAAYCGRAAADSCEDQPAAYKGKGQRGGERAAGLHRPARDRC